MVRLAAETGRMTPERRALMAAFLRLSGWEDAAPKDLAGDASMRRYIRLLKPSGVTAVLMDAPPESNSDIRPFTKIARFLTGMGLSAPQILSEDYDNGFLLLEDLGDALFARLMDDSPKLEPDLYRAAIDTLITLHQNDPPDLIHFGPELMTEQASLVFETWVTPLKDSAPQDSAPVVKQLLILLRQKTQGKPVMILRDFHAENLLWLPDRTGVAKVGLLDFQDAMLAHPAYDLVSLLQDVRRDVPADLEQEMIRYYIAQTDVDETDFRSAYVLLGVQRNLRILAVFARLVGTLGKPQYAQLIPRTWGHLMRGLAHPSIAEIAKPLIEILPGPSADNIRKLTRT